MQYAHSLTLHSKVSTVSVTFAYKIMNLDKKENNF